MKKKMENLEEINGTIAGISTDEVEDTGCDRAEGVIDELAGDLNLETPTLDPPDPNPVELEKLRLELLPLKNARASFMCFGCIF
uniref:Uncharacterized protein n=1 Tax=Solanum lycopersicum TaxID=4081 RepID=A0A3Q7GBX1_SOLLC